MIPPHLLLMGGVALAKAAGKLFGGSGPTHSAPPASSGGSHFERHCRMLSQACSMSIIRLDDTSASFRCGGDGEGYFVMLSLERGGTAVLAVLSRTEWPGRVPPDVREAVGNLDAKFRRSDWSVITLRGGESNVLARTTARSLGVFDAETFLNAAADLVMNMQKLDRAIRQVGLG